MPTALALTQRGLAMPETRHQSSREGAGAANQPASVSALPVPARPAHGASLAVLAHTSERVASTPATLPQVVREDSDLVALIRQHRARLGLAQFDLDQEAGIQDGYGSKLEGPGRAYGRRPTKLTKQVSVRFCRASGELVGVGRVDVDKRGSPLPVVTAQAVWYLQAMGLAVVVMDREQAEAMCDRPVPFQVPAGRARSGRRIRRLSLDLTVSGIPQAPMPVPPIRTDVLRELARKMSKALSSGRPGAISKAIQAARSAGVDPEALSMAVKMDAGTALALSDRLARVGAYLHALSHPDVTVGMVDVVEHVRDMPETEAAAHADASREWAATVETGRDNRP